MIQLDIIEFFLVLASGYMIHFAQTALQHR